MKLGELYDKLSLLRRYELKLAEYVNLMESGTGSEMERKRWAAQIDYLKQEIKNLREEEIKL